MVAERVVTVGRGMDAWEDVNVIETDYDAVIDEENFDEEVLETPQVQFMGRDAGEAAAQMTELQHIGGAVDLRGAQETRKEFVEGGGETGESTLEELKMLTEVSRESRASVLEALGSGEALITMAAGDLDVQSESWC